MNLNLKRWKLFATFVVIAAILESQKNGVLSRFIIPEFTVSNWYDNLKFAT